MAELTQDLLDACAREPIRTPGSIQPHGVFFALTQGDWRIAHASANAGRVLRCPAEDALGRSLHEVLAEPIEPALRELAGRSASEGLTPGPPVEIGGVSYHPVVHTTAGLVLLELEEAVTGHGAHLDELYAGVRVLVQELQEANTVNQVAEAAAHAVRHVTGFDRILVYSFDEHWNGTVLAESRNEVLPSYLDLRFPASDIPAQARDLYRLNRLRQIPDAAYAPVPILSAPDAPAAGQLDLSFSVLRSVSPVHVEYMRNMGTMASMSISIVVNGRLWGLISCHNGASYRAPQPVRAACDFIGQVVAMRLAGLSLYAEAAERVRLQSIHSRLLTAMATVPQFLRGLAQEGADLLALTGATGAAIVSDDETICIGDTPGEAEVGLIVAEIGSRAEDGVFATECVGRDLPELDADHLKDTAAGILAIAISQIHASYVLWFRPEVVRTVRWSGDPRKSVQPGSDRLHPRKSFEEWKETVRMTALPWSSAEIEAARGLRSSVIDIVLRRAEQLAELSGELERSNKELEAFSYSVSHDLRAPFRHIVGYAELLRERDGPRFDDKARHYLDNIIQSAFSAGRLVDDLLSFSQAGRVTLHLSRVDMPKLVDEVRRLLTPETQDRSITWRIAALPVVQGDPSLLRQVWQNLLSNAVKYTRGRDPAVIEIDVVRHEREDVFTVRDNGVGFDMSYVGKLFGVFQRLHRAEDFEGTGIGLANVRRMIERHGGRVWAEGVLGQGASFHFSIPHPEDR